MTTSTSRLPRFGLAAAAFGLTVALASPAAGQGQSAGDWRSQAFQGCWQPVSDSAAGMAASGLVCIVGGARSTSIDLITIAQDRVASRETIDITGERRPTEADGCTGWEQTEWSTDGRRIYRTSEVQCTNGTKRSMTGLFGLAPGGDWIDVMSVATGDNTGVRILHYRPTFIVSGALPADAADSLRQRTAAMSTARTAAAAPVGIREIVDVSRHVAPGVTQAWLGELGQKFDVSARDLIELADAGVPGRVTDLIVALAYPQAFGVRRAPSSGPAVSNTSIGGAGPMSLLDCRINPALWVNGCSYYDPFRFGMGYYGYGYNYYGLNRYGYSPYGTWYSGGDPVVIVVGGGGTGGSTGGTTHGQVVKDRGYTQGRSPDPAPASSAGTASPSSAPAPSSSSDGGGGGGGGSSSSSSGERTAHPR